MFRQKLDRESTLLRPSRKDELLFKPIRNYVGCHRKKLIGDSHKA